MGSLREHFVILLLLIIVSLMIYFIRKSKNWTGIYLHEEVKALWLQVESIKHNQDSLSADVGYFNRANTESMDNIVRCVHKIEARLDQINEFHERIANIENNCLIHEQDKEIKKALDFGDKK